MEDNSLFRMLTRFTVALVIASFGPAVSAAVLAVIFYQCVYLITLDTRQAALWSVFAGSGGWVGIWALMSDFAAQLVIESPIPPPDDKPEPPAAPPGWRSYNTAYSQTLRGLIEIHPPLPDFVDWRQMRRLAWGLMRQRATLAYDEWSPSVFRRDSQFIPLREWLKDHDMIVNRSSNPRSGVELSARGRDWMETILKQYGPPPIRQR